MPEAPFFVQIDTTLYRPQTRSHQRFQPYYPSFNRTLLISSINSTGGYQDFNLHKNLYTLQVEDLKSHVRIHKRAADALLDESFP